MKLLKALGVVVVVAGLAILTVSAQDRRDYLPRVHGLAVLAGRGAEIGVSVRDVDTRDAEKQKIDGGVLLDEVRPDSPAAKAGLKRSDIIVQFDGERVRSARQFSRLVQETAAGRAVKATVVRDGKRLDVEIAPSDREAFGWDDERLGDRIRERLGDVDMFADQLPAFDFHFDMPSMSARGHLGITVQTLSNQLAEYFGAKEGVLVTSVSEGSAAARAGIRAGDVITSVDGARVQSREDLQRSLRGEKDETTVGLMREKKEMSLTVRR
jgi:serine protease Do